MSTPSAGSWPKGRPRPHVFRTAQEAELSYEHGSVKLHDVAEYRNNNNSLNTPFSQCLDGCCASTTSCDDWVEK